MVAKLKTSFLKSGFQLFCHKNIFTPPETNSIEHDSHTARIKSSMQFSSSPNLSLPASVPRDTSDSKLNHSENLEADENFYSKASSRSASASGRVIDKAIENIEAETKNNHTTSKKVPKYVAKSKLNNHSSEQKVRSKSINSLSRENCNNNINNNNNSHFIQENGENDLHQDAKFFRHSFPNENNEVSQDIPKESNYNTNQAIDDNNRIKKGTDQNNNQLEFLIVNENEEQQGNVTNKIFQQQNGHVLYNDNNKVNVNNGASSVNGNGTLYKNNQSIASLKQAKKLQMLQRNATEISSIPGQENVNIKENSTPKKPIVFNHKNGLINTTSFQSKPINEPTSSILSKSQKNFSKSTSLNDNVRCNKKAVRFADSLGLELESFITLNQMDSNNAHRRRIVRLSNQSPNFNNLHYQQQAIQNHYVNPNSYKNQFAYATNANHYYQPNSNEKLNFAKVYSQKPYNNITHFNNDKILRHQSQEARKFIESNSSNNINKNHFENPNGQCLYDDIINKIAFSNDGKYQRIQDGGRVYISSSNSDKNLNNLPNVPYYLINNQQEQQRQSNSFDNLPQRQQSKGNNNFNGRSQDGRQQMNSTLPQNITITTRINNGKLESEV